MRVNTTAEFHDVYVAMNVTEARSIEHELKDMSVASDGALNTFWRALHNALQDAGRSTLKTRITDANHGTTDGE